MGPWGEPELLVWRPEAVTSEPLLPVGLEVKLGALLLLLVLTLVCSLVPICVLRRPGAHLEASASRQKALSLISCFAGGVFLATCLLDLLPDYLAAIDEALAALHVTVSTGQLHVTRHIWACSTAHLQERCCVWISSCVTPCHWHVTL